MFQDHCILNFVCVEKQRRPDHVRGYLPVQKLEDASLCPVSALVAYVIRYALDISHFGDLITYALL